MLERISELALNCVLCLDMFSDVGAQSSPPSTKAGKAEGLF